MRQRLLVTAAVMLCLVAALRASPQQALAAGTPPTMTMSFAPSTIFVNDTTVLTYTITNPNATPITGVSFTTNVSPQAPSGFLAQTSPAPGGTCNGTTSVVNGTAYYPNRAPPSSITHSGTSLAGNQSCTVTVSVQVYKPGAQSLTSDPVTSNETGPAATGPTANIQVQLRAAVISKVFNVTSVAQVGTTVRLTIFAQDPNPRLDNYGFAQWLGQINVTDNLPAGLVVANPPNFAQVQGQSVCSATQTGATAGSTAFTFTFSYVWDIGPTNCGYAVDLVTTLTGNITNTTQPPVSNPTTVPGQGATASLLVYAPLSLAKAFASSSIAIGETTSLTFTLTNANAGQVTSVAFSDPLPAGIVIATLNGLVNQCGGSVTANAGGSQVGVSGVTMAASSACTIKVNVTGTQAGSFVNQTTPLTGNPVGASAASAPIQVTSGGGAPCSNPMLSSNPQGPSLLLNTQVGFTAAVFGCAMPNYMWWVGKANGPNVDWVAQGPFAGTNTFSWTPTQTGTYYVGYWAKNQGSTPANGAFDVAAALQFDVAGASCGNATLNANPPGPNVPLNALVALTANATCSGTPSYMWWVGQVNGPNVNWTPATPFGPANTFNWTPNAAGSYYVGYWVKSQGATPANGSFDAAVALPFNVTGPCSNPGLNANPPGPNVLVNSTVMLTASATCSGVANYAWWVGAQGQNGVTWTQVAPYGASNTYNWTPTSVGTYYVGFWVKNQGSNPGPGYDAAFVLQFNVGASPCTNPTLNANPPTDPLTVGASVQFTGGVSCGIMPNYMWWVGKVNGPSIDWTQMTPYGPSNVFTWQPTQPGGYYVGFWAKNAGTTPANGAFDTSAVLFRTVN